MSEVGSGATAPAEAAAVESTDVAENYEAQADGTAEGERGELLPEAAAQVQEEQRKMLGRKKIATKVNGRESEVEIDLDNDEELARYIQKAMGADEKFQEAAGIRKQMQQFVQALKNDPLSILSHPDLGVDIKALAEKVINQEIENLQKSPEQKKMEDLERKLQDREDRLKATEEEKRTAEMSRLEEQAFQELDRDIDEALKVTTLPKSGYVMKRIADALISANDMGYTDVTVKDIMPYVESSMEAELQEMFGKMPEAVIEKLMGTNLDRVRKAKIAKVKTASAKVAESANSTKPKEEVAKDKVAFKSFFKQW